MEKAKATVEYEKPKIEDYGTLKELTATQSEGSHMDVPKGTPIPPFSFLS